MQELVDAGAIVDRDYETWDQFQANRMTWLLMNSVKHRRCERPGTTSKGVSATRRILAKLSYRLVGKARAHRLAALYAIDVHVIAFGG